MQVATVHVAQVAAHRPVDAHFAGVPPAHVVVGEMCIRDRLKTIFFIYGNMDIKFLLEHFNIAATSSRIFSKLLADS